MKRNIILATVGALAISSYVDRANAQAWLGQLAVDTAHQSSVGSCLGGRTLSASEINEAGTPAIALMSGFWLRTVAGRQVPATAMPLGTTWISVSTKTKVLNAAYLADPLAPSNDLMLIDQPIGFTRAGASPNIRAYGVWRIVSSTDNSRTVGFYKADFLRFMFKWQMQSVTALAADAEPIVAPFCETPGDIEKDMARREERSKRKAQKKELQQKAQ